MREEATKEGGRSVGVDGEGPHTLASLNSHLACLVMTAARVG